MDYRTPLISDSKDDNVILTNGTCDNGAEADSTGQQQTAPPAVGKCSRLQYNREEMLILEKADLALLRPQYLDAIFDRFDTILRFAIFKR